MTNILMIHFFSHLLLKTCLAIHHRTACFPSSYILIIFKHRTPHTEVVHAPQASIFSTVKARGTHLFGSSCHFVRNDQNKLLAHDKNRKRAELRVKINLFNVFVMYALDLAHVKVQCLKRSRSFAVLFDKPGRIEPQVNPNTILQNLIGSNVELYMCQI